jgi:hypothetical protein
VGVAPVPGHQRRAAGTAWVLTFLTTLSSVVFAMGAIAGWVLGLWPATPLTLLAASVVVLGGPLAALLLARRISAPVAAVPALPVRVREPARRQRPAAAPPQFVMAAAAPPPPPPLPLTPEQAWGRELLDWRDRPPLGR